MSSRFDSIWDSEGTFSYEFWLAMVNRTFRSKAGRKRLEELKQILLAMPNKRLISGNLSTKEGDVCAVGAWVVAKEMKKDPALTWAEACERYSYAETAGETAAAGKRTGLGWVMSWEIEEWNDEHFSKLTPEERYTKVIEWIDKELARKPSGSGSGAVAVTSGS